MQPGGPAQQPAGTVQQPAGLQAVDQNVHHQQPGSMLPPQVGAPVALAPQLSTPTQQSSMVPGTQNGQATLEQVRDLLNVLNSGRK